MDIKKKKAFNEKMGLKKRFPGHLVLARGGMIDGRKRFDSGGDVATNTVGGGLGSMFTPQNTYEAQLAPTTQLNYAPTVASAATGALDNTNVNNAITAEQALAGQYGTIAAGGGPNPAQATLNQQTSQNIAQTAALQAGQRGSSANAGLMARQIGQTGAATQQAGVQQAATLQAGQQLGALGAEGALQGQIGNQGLGEQGAQASVYGTAASGNAAQNNTNVNNYAQAQGLNQSTASANAAANQKTTGGIIGGIGSLLSALHEGGEVQKFDDGGGVYPSLGVDTSMPTAPVVTPTPSTNINGGASPQSFVGQALSKGTPDTSSGDSDPTGFKSLGSALGGAAVKNLPIIGSLFGGGSSGGGGSGGVGALAGLAALFADGGPVCEGPHASHVANFMFAEGGKANAVPALVSAKEVYLNPSQVKEVVERGADPMKIGYRFPGKDKVRHNSLKNDKIPVTLQDGGVVIPIDITTHKESSTKGRDFVVKAHNKRYMKKPKGMKANA